MISFALLCRSLKPFTVTIWFSLARNHRLPHSIWFLLDYKKGRNETFPRFSFGEFYLQRRKYSRDAWAHCDWSGTILWTQFRPCGMVRIKSQRQFNGSLLSVFVEDQISEWYKVLSLSYLSVWFQHQAI